MCCAKLPQFYPNKEVQGNCSRLETHRMRFAFLIEIKNPGDPTRTGVRGYEPREETVCAQPHQTVKNEIPGVTFSPHPPHE